MPRILLWTTDFAVDCLNIFVFRALTDRQKNRHTDTDATDDAIHASDTVGVGNNGKLLIIRRCGMASNKRRSAVTT